MTTIDKLPGNSTQVGAPVRSANPRPWWRFSLREFLLAVTAVGALVALAVQSWPSSPSAFVRRFDPQAEFKAICAKRGIKFGSSGSGSGSSSGGGYTSKRWHFASHQDQAVLGSLAADFADRVEAILVSQKCQITGRSKTWIGSQNQRNLAGFGYSYRSGSQQGDLVVEFIELSDGQFRWYAFCVEFTKR
jgi:hypothetical protein